MSCPRCQNGWWSIVPCGCDPKSDVIQYHTSSGIEVKITDGTSGDKAEIHTGPYVPFISVTGPSNFPPPTFKENVEYKTTTNTIKEMWDSMIQRKPVMDEDNYSTAEEILYLHRKIRKLEEALELEKQRRLDDSRFSYAEIIELAGENDQLRAEIDRLNYQLDKKLE